MSGLPPVANSGWPPEREEGIALATQQSRKNDEKQNTKRALAKLQNAKVASADDRVGLLLYFLQDANTCPGHAPDLACMLTPLQEMLISTSKSDMHSVKTLGEGAFGIVDLVVVDNAKGCVLCVRKKLLKQTDTNHADPALEVGCTVRVCLCTSIFALGK